MIPFTLTWLLQQHIYEDGDDDDDDDVCIAAILCWYVVM